jgi:hypothetical protein
MDVSPIVNLGIGGFAIYIMWRMYESSAKERNEHFRAFRELESDIRNKFAAQLMENTNAMLEHSKIMATVLKLIDKVTEK